MSADVVADPDVLFSRRTAAAIVVLGVVSFAAMLYFMSRGESAPPSLTADPSVFSTSALGHRAAATFLRESGLTVKTRRSRRSLAADAKTAVVVAEPVFKHEDRTREEAEADLDALAEQAADLKAPFVIVLPKWKGAPIRTGNGMWIKEATLKERSVVVEALDQLSDSGARPSNIVRPAGQATRTIQTDAGTTVELVAPQFLRPGTAGVRPIVSTRDGVLIGRIVSPFGEWFVVSDPDLLNNHGLARADNASTFLAFLRDRLGVRGVVFDEVSHGLAAETPFMAELLNFPLVLVVVHGALLFGLLVLRGLARFGKPTPFPPRLMPGKTGLIENTAQLLASRGRLLTSARRYYVDVVAEVAVRYHRDPNENPETLHKALQEATTKKGIEFNLMEVAKTMAGRGRSSTAAILEAAVALHDWRERMLDER
jgi:hypothetical protein